MTLVFPACYARLVTLGAVTDATRRATPGERLGLPATGSGSIARLGRRIGALFIDWARAVPDLGRFFGCDAARDPRRSSRSIQILFMPTLRRQPRASPPRHASCTRLDGGWVGLWRPIVRTALLIVVIPAVIWDADQRGLHDKAAGTVLVRA